MRLASDCPFCSPEPGSVIYRGAHVTALWDMFPLNPGHALIVPNRHVASWFEASAEERAALMRGVEVCKAEIEKVHRVDGYKRTGVRHHFNSVT